MNVLEYFHSLYGRQYSNATVIDYYYWPCWMQMMVMVVRFYLAGGCYGHLGYGYIFDYKVGIYWVVWKLYNIDRNNEKFGNRIK